MERHRVTFRRLRNLALAFPVVACLSGTARAAEPKLVLHASRASMSEPCQPGISRCEEAVVTGSLYSPTGTGNYFVYLMASQFDATEGIRSIQTGIDYDAVTGSGVDIFSWNHCSDSEQPASGWYQEAKSANRLTWNVERCPSDTLVVGGFFYMTCYTSSFLTVSPFGNDPAAIQTCLGNNMLLPPTALGYVGFGTVPGCNPCLAACNTVPVLPTTWSRLKSIPGPGR
jgi:hypothetical protein